MTLYESFIKIGMDAARNKARMAHVPELRMAKPLRAAGKVIKEEAQFHSQGMRHAARRMKREVKAVGLQLKREMHKRGPGVATELKHRVSTNVKGMKDEAKAAGRAVGRVGKAVKDDFKPISDHFKQRRAAKAAAPKEKKTYPNLSGKAITQHTRDLSFTPKDRPKPKPKADPKHFVPLADKPKAKVHVAPSKPSSSVKPATSAPSSPAKKQSFMTKGEAGAAAGVALGTAAAAYGAHRLYKAYKNNKAQSEAQHRQRQLTQ